jgi:hypothetical protein
MDESQKKMTSHLDSLPLSEARGLVAAHHYGKPGSVNQNLCESWLATKEADQRELHESESVSISQKALRYSKFANIIAVLAIVLSAITAIAIACVTN